jgi:hypothetical protein
MYGTKCTYGTVINIPDDFEDEVLDLLHVVWRTLRVRTLVRALTTSGRLINRKNGENFVEEC